MSGLVLSAEQNGENLSFHGMYIPEKIEKNYQGTMHSLKK